MEPLPQNLSPSRTQARKILSFGKKAFFLMIFCTIFTSLGQILWKLGLNRINFSQLATFFNWPFLVGFVAYGLGALLMLLALRRGKLSVLYPIVSTSYVWVSLVSPLLFPADSMNWQKWVGVALILVSVSLLGLGSTKTEAPPQAKAESGAGAAERVTILPPVSVEDKK
jgi:uncharacterized membrane protein